MNILIIDDEDMTLRLLERKLESEGYTVFKAADAFKALYYIENEKIDLVITDVVLPGISGLGLINLLRRYYRKQNPIIFISSLEQDIIDSAGELGVYDFVSKPINFDLLFNKIRSFPVSSGNN
jgi:DNA-binding response OmpR family regulator